MRVSQFTHDGCRAACRVDSSLGDRTLFVESGEGELPNPGVADWALCALLLPPMALHEDLSLAFPVSRRLAENLEVIQDILLAWVPHTCRSGLEFPVIDDPRPAPGTSLFFSGGLDAVYSLVKNRSKIDGLVLVHGFDIPAAESEAFSKCRESLKADAAGFGLDLRSIRTNSREISDDAVHWIWQHGAALASVAHVLGPSTVYIASTHAYRDLHPLGSHPLLDPLWSSASVRLVHDGAEANRVGKARMIARQSPGSLRRLRVCLAWEHGGYNCGQCEKCLQTMLCLQAAGALDRCETLPQRIDPESVRKVGVNPFTKWHWKYLPGEIGDPVLDEAVREVLRKARPGQDSPPAAPPGEVPERPKGLYRELKDKMHWRPAKPKSPPSGDGPAG
ncbi:MAG: hypothetical protein KA419_03080 [Acidobacteria bacterium]|nr:hypothetical protein [Acidobacteriota bacterium]